MRHYKTGSYWKKTLLAYITHKLYAIEHGLAARASKIKNFIIFILFHEIPKFSGGQILHFTQLWKNFPRRSSSIAIKTGNQHVLVMEITECALFLVVLSFVFLMAASRDVSFDWKTNLWPQKSFSEKNIIWSSFVLL